VNDITNSHDPPDDRIVELHEQSCNQEQHVAERDGPGIERRKLLRRAIQTIALNCSLDLSGDGPEESKINTKGIAVLK
jgi:hypothetical protein